MPPKTERFELRLEVETIGRVDEWRRAQSDNPSRSEAMRRLIETGLETTTTRQVFLATKFQIMTAALTPGPRQRIADAYLYAWDAEVYPLFDDGAEWHKPFETSFSVSKEMVSELSKYLDELWINGKDIPSFYDLEDHYGVRHGRTEWDRHGLLVALRYMWLKRLFDEPFWNAILKPMEHPSEASSITSQFNRDEDIYFN
ncbi:MAG TPA: ribbon-helix-helix domain-containing protein [Terriglobia bacterium]|nr:ribbon-helix-helix domain-containing protein [Terriglobia bacterium]